MVVRPSGALKQSMLAKEPDFQRIMITCLLHSDMNVDGCDQVFFSFYLRGWVNVTVPLAAWLPIHSCCWFQNVQIGMKELTRPDWKAVHFLAPLEVNHLAVPWTLK
jgi:hypothetical protein